MSLGLYIFAWYSAVENPVSEEDQQQRVGTETGSPRKVFLQAEPLQWIRKTFQGLCSHRCGFACMQNSPAEQRSGHSSQVGEWSLSGPSGGENT